MKITDFEKKDFGGAGLPKGDTVIDFETLEIEPTIIEYDGEKKTRYLLQVNAKDYYYVPKGVMADLLEVRHDGFKKARITRTGENLETRYTVIGLK